MLVRPSRKRAAMVPMSRFDGLVTMADVPSSLLGVMVPVGRRKCSDTLCHGLRRIDILALIWMKLRPTIAETYRGARLADAT